jgi:catechol 2,3-dioxygenase-like lactoylglutathione lyase family enzyme
MAQLSRAAPQLFVKDVVETASFYRDVLGFTVKGLFGAPPIFAVLDRDGARLLFKRAPPAHSPLTSNAAASEGFTDLFFYADDVTALADEFAARGAQITEPPRLQVDYDAAAMTVRDCNGYALCFSQLRNPAPDELSWPPAATPE